MCPWTPVIRTSAAAAAVLVKKLLTIFCLLLWGRNDRWKGNSRRIGEQLQNSRAGVIIYDFPIPARRSPEQGFIGGHPIAHIAVVNHKPDDKHLEVN